MNKQALEVRKEKISALYRNVLDREPDDPGLNAYLYSDVPIEDIEKGMQISDEYQELQRKKNFGKQLQTLGTGELLLMGSSPRTDEHVEALKSSGVEALLSLDGKFERPYNHQWCKFYSSVPLSNERPMTEGQVSDILDFIYTNVVVGGRKTFIHSDLGMSRSPMVIALFLVADKQMPLMQALTIISAKQNMVNPSRALITGTILNFAKEYTFKDAGKTKAANVHTTSDSGITGELDFVTLNNNILLGVKLTSKMANQFRSADVDVVVDLNDTRSDLPTEARWFSHIHLPLLDEQINEMMPIILRNVKKYSARGRVYVMCDTMPKLMLFAENYTRNSGDAALAGKMTALRSKMVSL